MFGPSAEAEDTKSEQFEREKDRVKTLLWETSGVFFEDLSRATAEDWHKFEELVYLIHSLITLRQEEYADIPWYYTVATLTTLQHKELSTQPDESQGFIDVVMSRAKKLLDWHKDPSSRTRKAKRIYEEYSYSSRKRERMLTQYSVFKNVPGLGEYMLILLGGGADNSNWPPQARQIGAFFNDENMQCPLIISIDVKKNYKYTHLEDPGVYLCLHITPQSDLNNLFLQLNLRQPVIGVGVANFTDVNLAPGLNRQTADGINRNIVYQLLANAWRQINGESAGSDNQHLVVPQALTLFKAVPIAISGVEILPEDLVRMVASESFRD